MERPASRVAGRSERRLSLAVCVAACGGGPPASQPPLKCVGRAGTTLEAQRYEPRRPSRHLHAALGIAGANPNSDLDAYGAEPLQRIAGTVAIMLLKRWKLDRIRRAGTRIMGRVTYEQMAAAWPTSTDDYAGPMNEIPKVVFSKTLDKATWAGTSIARGELADEIATLRDQPGGETIAWGGAEFTQSLSRAGPIDEYVLVIKPVAYGGLPIFRDLPDALQLDLIEARKFDSGVVLHRYQPASA